MSLTTPLIRTPFDPRVWPPQPGWCVAVLTPAAFARPKPHPQTQTWWLAVRRDGVLWRREGEAFIFAAGGWTGSKA